MEEQGIVTGECSLPSEPRVVQLAENVTIVHGDSEVYCKSLSGVHACVTDPPYGLCFMGKKWDYDVPSTGMWQVILNALLPGAHLLGFSGTRTQHRMACAIEDAGFEIRDMIAWVYGSGFPKSLDVSKAIDKAAGVEREVVGPNKFAHLNGKENATCYGVASRPDATRQWSGWGTALKPALEPITVARKPLIGTVASNVLEHGTGAINVDGCRVPGGDSVSNHGRKATQNGWDPRLSGGQIAAQTDGQKLGRWPANLIHDGSEEVLDGFPVTTSGKAEVGTGRPANHTRGVFGHKASKVASCYADTGSAARFFYCAKASKSNRNEGMPEGKSNKHPTVKPTELMRYLCRLVTPPGGIVLDPFMGSGSTGVAAIQEGFGFIGVERDLDSFETAKARLEHALSWSMR